ncbi:hypothetical protein IQ251_11545 [Saccharopolyspora sp. HNM0983]|uniref:Uncharacterized protein n=1 Tax=Saccharopolyspora montiporae TaxID=2781240 RepID=A0A929BAA5_9PSEU|nr:hypothetical protein [Saccharopolyspora sp. HNM0983]MBE9375075.1 hypothetical protein [Saccharopolyspora sp. HNM0983]
MLRDLPDQDGGSAPPGISGTSAGDPGRAQRPTATRDAAHAHPSGALSASVAHRLLAGTRATAEERFPRRHRVLFAGTAAVFALVSCMALGSVTGGGPDPAPRVTAAPISGSAALLPDVVAEREWPFTGDRPPGPVRAAEPGSASPGLSAARIMPFEGPPPEPPDAVNPAAGSDASAVRVAEEFCRRLAESPHTAPELLTPGLRGGDAGALVRAWSAVDEVRHRVRGEPEHRATVRLEAVYPDGRRVALHQLLTVEPGSHPRIREAVLLNGRHTPLP